MERRAHEPLVTFYQVWSDAPPPSRADPSLSGSIPLRAYRYCDPFTTASGFGWYMFPPLSFALRWNGSSVDWKPARAPKWVSLETVGLPGYREQYEQAAPVGYTSHEILAESPPLLTAIHEPGIVQLWTGLLARTQPGWALLIRPPANLPRIEGAEVLEGIIETDWWFGPLIFNVRLTKTDQPILFETHTPFCQAQPIPTEAYSDEALSSMVLRRGLSEFTREDWKAYADAILLRHREGARVGSYKREARSRKDPRGQADHR